MFECLDGASRASRNRVGRVHVQWRVFGEWLRAWSVRERNALRDDVTHARSDAGVDQVLRTDLSKSRIAGEGVRQFLGAELLWQIGELMNDCRRLRGEHSLSQRVRVEDVDDRRRYSQCLESLCGFSLAGRADDLPSISDEQPAESTTNDSRRPGNEDARVDGQMTDSYGTIKVVRSTDVPSPTISV